MGGIFGIKRRSLLLLFTFFGAEDIRKIIVLIIIKVIIIIIMLIMSAHVMTRVCRVKRACGVVKNQNAWRCRWSVLVPWRLFTSATTLE